MGGDCFLQVFVHVYDGGSGPASAQKKKIQAARGCLGEAEGRGDRLKRLLMRTILVFGGGERKIGLLPQQVVLSQLFYVSMFLFGY